jgi:signal peptidase I
MKPGYAWLFRAGVVSLLLAAGYCVRHVIVVARLEGMRSVVDTMARTPLGNVVAFIAILSVFRLAIYPYLQFLPAAARGVEFALGKTVNEFLDALVYAGIFVFMIIRPFGVQAFLIPSGSMWPTLHINDFIVANKAVFRYTDPQDNDIVVFRPPKRAVYPNQLDSHGDVNVDFIKRLIGSPGETVELRKGVLYRNGKPDTSDDSHRHFSKCADMILSGECQDFVDLPNPDYLTMTKASFKLVKYKGEIIPLNYTSTDANSGSPIGGPNEQMAPYQVAKEYEVDDPDEQRKLIREPAQPVPKGMYFFMGDNRNGSFDSRGWGLVPRESIIGRAEFIWFPLTRLGRVR